jgi:hypothetical protein
MRFAVKENVSPGMISGRRVRSRDVDSAKESHGCGGVNEVIQ